MRRLGEGFLKGEKVGVIVEDDAAAGAAIEDVIEDIAEVPAEAARTMAVPESLD